MSSFFEHSIEFIEDRMLGSDLVLFKTHGGKSSFINLIDLLLVFAISTLISAWSPLSPLCKEKTNFEIKAFF